MLFVDKMTLDAQPRKTSDGYLVASPKVARAGIQEYMGAEVGRPAMDRVRVYRPEDEVFAQDAMFSFGHRPVTVDHPPELVDAKNWKKYARGQTGGDIVRDKEFIVVPMVLMDSEAIGEVEDGKIELSMGYTADLDFTAGTTPEGEQYDAIQRNIRGNHLAIVDAARGGSQLRVIDTQPKQGDLLMTLKTILVDGISVEVSDTAAQVINKHLGDMSEEMKKDQARMKDLEDELATLKKKMDADKKTSDAEIATLKKQVEDAALTPDRLDAAVKDRATIIDAAKKVLPSVLIDGKSDAEIRKQVVDAKLGDAAKDWNDEQVAASFNTLTAGAATVDSYAQHMQQRGQQSQEQTGRDGYVKSLNDAWKHKPATH